MTDRPAGQDGADAVAERADLRAGRLGRLNREAPGAIDMADHRKGAAVRVSKQALRQGRDEWLRRQWQRLAGLGKIHQELIGVGRAGDKTGEQQCDHAVDIGVVGDVGGGQEMLLAHAAVSRPVLAQQRPLGDGLSSLAGSQRNAVRRCKQHRRRLCSVQRFEQAGLRRIVAKPQLAVVADLGVDGLFQRAGRSGDSIGERVDQQRCAVIALQFKLLSAREQGAPGNRRRNRDPPGRRAGSKASRRIPVKLEMYAIKTMRVVINSILLTCKMEEWPG